MQIGFIGLGKMGFLLAKQLVEAGNEVYAWDQDKTQCEKFSKIGGKHTTDLSDLIGSLKDQRIIWLMVPAGEAVDQVIREISPLLKKDDIVIDGGNSFYKDSIRQYDFLRQKEIHFIDCGTSGGLEGAVHGACLMVGGDESVVKRCEDLFKSLATENGYLYCGKSGSGHYVKMIHNGIEYGMMQSIAEGFELLKAGEFKLDLKEVAKLWSNGSVIRGWLMDLIGNAFEKDPDLSRIKGVMSHSGEGKWTAQTALELEVPAPVITQSLQVRFRSKQKDTFTGKVVSALRNEFGGHEVENA